MNNAAEKIDKLTWAEVLGEEKQKEYFQKVIQFVEGQRKAGKTIYPKNSNVFNALKITPLEKTKVIIIGQDPYHGPGQAHGLCFSVQPGVPHPPSLQNIFKELNQDLGINYPKSGYLVPWAEQGVLLLNAVLTVEQGKPQSHANQGWEVFTDRIISILNEKKENLIFMLWGAYAQKKGELVDPIKHHILQTTHPSPLSASRGFLGSGHFSEANKILEQTGQKPINWDLTP